MKIAFICLGNICRSPMAEFVMKDLLAKSSSKKMNEVEVHSFGTSDCNHGYGIYPAARNMLDKQGIPYGKHFAKGLSKDQYDKFDYFLCMDSENVEDTCCILGHKDKVHRLLDYTDTPGDVADPWYTGDFNLAYEDIKKGCEAFLNKKLKVRE